MTRSAMKALCVLLVVCLAACNGPDTPITLGDTSGQDTPGHEGTDFLARAEVSATDQAGDLASPVDLVDVAGLDTIDSTGPDIVDSLLPDPVDQVQPEVQDAEIAESSCGNATCDGEESPCTCPQDCAVGDGSEGAACCDQDDCIQPNCFEDCCWVHCEEFACSELYWGEGCCGNGVCEVAGGEDPNSCVEDCGYCGDGVCMPVIDTPCNCPADCGDPCEGKECGSDGCGGLCGECADGETCTEQAQCVPAAECTPEGQVLGPDPCCPGLEPRLQAVLDVADCPAVDGACCYICQYTEITTWTCEKLWAGLNPCNSHAAMCHDDPDMDGVWSEVDNCPTVPNPSSAEVDGDGIGDACDPDIDGDGVPNELDCAPWNVAVYPGAGNDPWNLLDDDCDGDLDDGDPAAPSPCYDELIPDYMDNCPLVCNPTQEDLDGDGNGDPCDDDVDGDWTPNDQDCAVYNGEIHPGALEACNGVDDDCDGQADEDCPCTPEFVSFGDPFPWLLCCPGLVAAQACSLQSGPDCEDLACLFECSCLEPLGFNCVPCGNGICDVSETVCTCPEDCV